VNNPVNKVENQPHLHAKKVLGIFAKEPVPGQVKTRLTPPLTSREASSLYSVSLDETVASMDPFSPVIFFAGESSYFQKRFPHHRHKPQGNGDLGARLDRAFSTLFSEGYGRVVIIGSDTPDLPVSIVKGAFSALGNSDAVVAPAADGGYVLIGQSSHHSALFTSIPWSTPDVLAATREVAEKEGLSFSEIGGWEDVDDVGSLTRLLERSPRSPTARLGKALLSGRIS